MQLAQPSVDWTMRCPARVQFSLTTTADKDETSKGNPGNSNGDAVDVVPPVDMAEPRARGPVVPSELRSAILQHGPCRLKGLLDISSENGNRRIFSGKRRGPVVRRSLWMRPARVRSPGWEARIIRCKNLALYIGDCESLVTG